MIKFNKLNNLKAQLKTKGIKIGIKMVTTFVLLVLTATLINGQEVIHLYPDHKIPFAKTGGEVPRLTWYKPANVKTDICVIVCSGGSYGGRANDWEGIPACKALNAAGINAFLLDYRLPRAKFMDHKEIVPLTDAQRAIVLLRSNAKVYGVNPDKLGIMGFSAGGHLVTTVETHFKETALKNPNRVSLRPDFVVAVYPVVSMADSLTHLQSREHLLGPDITAEKIRAYSNELQVTDGTPPTFIIAAVDDDVVKIQNSLYLEAALRQHRVPVKMFIYAKGGHGFGVDHIKNVSVRWTEPCFKWILSGQWAK
jgi:acetyl esterase/lipase